MTFESRPSGESAAERLTDRLTRRETECQRKARITRKAVDPETAAALRRLWR